MRRNHTKELLNVFLYDQLYFTSEKLARATEIFFRFKGSQVLSSTTN